MQIHSKELNDSFKKISKTYREPSQSLIYSKEIKYEIRSPERSDHRDTRRRSKSRRTLDDGWLEIDSFDELLRSIEAELAEFDTKTDVQKSTGYNQNYGYSNAYYNYNSYQQTQPYNYYQTYQNAFNYGYNYPYNYNSYQSTANYNQCYNYFPNPPQLSNLGYAETPKQEHKSRKPSKSRDVYLIIIDIC